VTPKLDMTGGDYTLTDNTAEASPVMQQIGILNLRINDMMTQLNAVMKTMMEENTALKKENAELKAKQEKTSKS
jgi:regulator of replication initiation timing